MSLPQEPAVPAVTVIRAVAGASGLAWAVGDDGRLHQLAFGSGESAAVANGGGLPVGIHPLAYPTYGEEPLREPALRVTHADGVTSTRLVFVGHDVSAATDGAGEVHRVHLADRVAPLDVTLVVRTHPDHDVVEQWVEVHNRGDREVTVHQVGSTAPLFAGPAATLTHWGGGWADEWGETTERITAGVKTVASAGGVRPGLYRAPVILIAPDGDVTETHGAVGAFTVLWGGDVRFDIEAVQFSQFRVMAGNQHRGAERRLEPGATFESPHVAWTWSNAGKGPTSRALHRFARERVVRDGIGRRAIVVNTWEAMGFDLDTPKLLAQVERAAEVGGEVFLLDDGWFGTTDPRRDDTTGLGDWQVDAARFPHGLTPVIEATEKAGMRFGLWVEPEMVNPNSALYRAHRDWVIAEPGRDRREERNQLVLDVCRPEVAAFVVDTIDEVLAANPGVTYLKWDANRDITEGGSLALAPDRQTHLAVDRVRATWAVMAEVARRHPGVELMACASGGGRCDLGTMRYFHELWTSDNTDPVDRVRIQWGASHLLPASVLGAHVTRWGQRPLAFASAVAMSGRFGFDLDLTALTAAELALCAQGASCYRLIADVVQQGDLYRLVSPVGSDRAAWAYRHGDRTVVFAFTLPADPDRPSGPGGPSPIGFEHLDWLDPNGAFEAADLTPSADGSPEADFGPWAGSVAWSSESAPAASIWLIRPQ